MNRERIIRMAREAGMQLAWIATVPDTNKMKVLCDFDQVQHFATIIAAAECEAVIAIVNDNSDSDGLCCTDDLLAAIRARGNT